MYNKFQKPLLGIILALSFQLPVLAKLPINWYSSIYTFQRDWKLSNNQLVNSDRFYVVSSPYIFATKKWEVMLLFSRYNKTLEKIYLSRVLDPKLSIKQQLDFLLKALKREFGDMIYITDSPYEKTIYWLNSSEKVFATYEYETRILNVYISKE